MRQRSEKSTYGKNILYKSEAFGKIKVRTSSQRNSN